MQDQIGLPEGFYEVLVTDNRDCTLSLNATLTDTPSLEPNNQAQNVANFEFIGTNSFNSYSPAGEKAVYVEWDVNEPSSLEILDISGKQISIANLHSKNGKMVFDIQSSGSYFVRFVCASGSRTKKVVVY
jgi:hypothetical protein